ncbi:TolC family protein [Flavobacteriaceae bacterium]|nr:TolC family protein [Flavobacteriaceae bacterium]
MKSRTILLLTSIILLSTSNSFAITLEDAILAAKENNYEIKSQEYSYKAAKSEKLKSLGGFLPQVSIDVNNGSRKTKIGSQQRINDDVDTKSFTASQNLFNGFGSVSELKKANNILKREKAIKDSKIQQVTLNVIRSYLDILKYQKLLEIGKENLKSQKSLLYYIKRKFKVKDATKSEIAKAEADYIKAKNDQAQTQNHLDLSKANFIRYTGLTSINGLTEIKEEVSRDNQDIDQLYKIALETNPEIQAAKYGFIAARHNANVSKSALSPKVTLNFDVREEKNSRYLNNQQERDTSVYLNVNVPIFNSGQSYFDISSTSNSKKKEKYNYEAVKKQIYNSIIEYSNKKRNSESSYKSAKELERANKIYLRTLRQEEKFGTKSIIELLEAKQNLYTSQVEVTGLYYDKIYSGFELDALVGRLTQK